MATVPDDMKIGKYFKASEFVCKCGCGCLVYDFELIRRLDSLREAISRPIFVNSGYRCSKHNRTVGGVWESHHTEGKAADIRVSGMTPKQLAAEAEKIGFGGIGTYSTFVHVDIRESKVRWNG